MFRSHTEYRFRYETVVLLHTRYVQIREGCRLYFA